MKRWMIIALAVLFVLFFSLTGCTTVKPVPQFIFPDPPADLMVPPPALQTIPVKDKTP